jgi:hypothetical protein
MSYFRILIYVLACCAGFALGDWLYSLPSLNNALPIYLTTNAPVGVTGYAYDIPAMRVPGAGVTNTALPAVIVGADATLVTNLDFVTQQELTDALRVARVYDDNTLIVSGVEGQQEAANGTYRWSSPEYGWFNPEFDHTWEQWAIYPPYDTNFCKLYYYGDYYWHNDSTNPWEGTWSIAMDGVVTASLVVSGLEGDEEDANGLYALTNGTYVSTANSDYFIAWNDEAWCLFSNDTPALVALYTNTVTDWADMPIGMDWDAVDGACTLTSAYAITSVPTVTRAEGTGGEVLGLAIAYTDAATNGCLQKTGGHNVRRNRHGRQRDHESAIPHSVQPRG